MTRWSPGGWEQFAKLDFSAHARGDFECRTDFTTTRRWIKFIIGTPNTKSRAKTDPHINEIPKASTAMTGGELKVLWGHEAEKIFWLDSYCTIGRSKECTIVFDNITVSRRHAEIRWTPEGYVLGDLNSTSGIYVNDRLVKQCVLQDGDRIRIGQVMLEWTSGHNRVYQAKVKGRNQVRS